MVTTQFEYIEMVNVILTAAHQKSRKQPINQKPNEVQTFISFTNDVICLYIIPFDNISRI